MRVVRKSLFGVAVAIAIQFAGGSASQASTLTYHGFAAPGGTGVKYTIDGSYKSHGAGAFHMKDTSGNSLLAFCIDLFNTIKGSWNYTSGDSFVPVNGQANTAAVTSNMKKLFTAHYHEALTSKTTAE